MAITTIDTSYKQEKGINYSIKTDSSSDFPNVPNSTYFYNKEDGLPYYKDSEGDVITVFEKSGINASNFEFIYDKGDFPDPVAGVITLIANKTYFIASNIDLTGDRLVGGQNTTIIGGSSENCSLTSTGLGVGVPLFTTQWTTPIRHVTFKDVDTAINIDGTINPPLALDWTGVNFLNIPNIGIVNTSDNFIYSKGAFLNSKGLSFDGSQGTIAFDNSLFSGDGLAGNIIDIKSTCLISRRFRINYSSIIAFTSTVGINFDVSATVPTESYILDTVNFSGGGTYTTGVNYLDNKVNWENCKGVINTSTFANYYMINNATPTVVSVVGTPYKVLGITTANAINQKFTHTDNRATYSGELSKDFQVTAIVTFTTGNNKVVGLYVAKNGTVLQESEMYATSSGSGRAESISVQTVLSLDQNDYIELFIENVTDITDITVEYLNLIVKSLS